MCVGVCVLSWIVVRTCEHPGWFPFYSSLVWSPGGVRNSFSGKDDFLWKWSACQFLNIFDKALEVVEQTKAMNALWGAKPTEQSDQANTNGFPPSPSPSELQGGRQLVWQEEEECSWGNNHFIHIMPNLFSQQSSNSQWLTLMTLFRCGSITTEPNFWGKISDV